MLTIKNLEVPTMNRNGESFNVPKRKQRFFNKDDYWYYSTREGIDIGPFDTQQEAQTGISDFIDFILHAEPQVVDSLSQYRQAS